MQIDQAIKTRRSIRKFQSKPVPDPVLRQIVDLARFAPSSMDGQPWSFLIIRNSGIKKEIAAIKNKYCPAAKRAYRADFLVQAPVLILVCADKKKSFGRHLENGILAASFILLGAASRRLGSVFLTSYYSRKPRLARDIKRLLNLPNHIDPIAILPLGYPAESPGPKKLRAAKTLIHYEKF